MNLRLDLEIVTLTPVPAVVLSRRTDWGSFERSTLEGIQRVRKAVAAARVPTAGPPFIRFLSPGPRLRLDIGIPLDGPHAVPTLRTTILPGGEAATLWHTGPAGEVSGSLDRLGRWVDGHADPAGHPWQWYWSEPDSERPLIQVVWPMRRR